MRQLLFAAAAALTIAIAAPAFAHGGGSGASSGGGGGAVATLAWAGEFAAGRPKQRSWPRNHRESGEVR